MSLNEMLPFSMERRKEYDFELTKEIEHNGIPVYILEPKAKSPDEKYWEGQYLIQNGTYAFRFL